MLILTRRKGESLMIGDDISVTVLGVRGTQVRIGVNAPQDVSVHRQEIYDRIKSQNEQEGGGERRDRHQDAQRRYPNDDDDEEE